MLLTEAGTALRWPVGAACAVSVSGSAAGFTRSRRSRVGWKRSAAPSRRPRSADVQPPSWRPDLTRAADLVEEVLRLEGYQTIPVTLPRAPAGLGLTAAQRARRATTAALSDAGFAEVLLLPFVAGDVADRLGLAADDSRRARRAGGESAVGR